MARADTLTVLVRGEMAVARILRNLLAVVLGFVVGGVVNMATLAVVEASSAE